MLAIYVIGVCGVGKTQVGRYLAKQLESEFIEGDAYHPAENVEKMRQG